MFSQWCRCALSGSNSFTLRIGLVDVLGIARQSHPPERANAPAKERPDIGRNEAGKIEGVGDAFILRHLADIVAVIDGRHAALLEFQHRVNVMAIDCFRRPLDRLRIALPHARPLIERPAFGKIAVDRVVRGGLVRQKIRPHARPQQFGQDLGGVAQQPDRYRLLLAARSGG